MKFKLKGVFNGLLGKTYIFQNIAGGPKYWVTANWLYWVKVPKQARFIPIQDWNVLSYLNWEKEFKK